MYAFWMLEAFPLLRLESAGIQAFTFHALDEKSPLENLTGPRGTKDNIMVTTHKKLSMITLQWNSESVSPAISFLDPTLKQEE